MKLSRTLPSILASITAFALIIPVAQTNSSLSRAHSARRQIHSRCNPVEDSVITTRGKSVTVFLHGIMVGYNNTREGRFEVGIVRRAPYHKFAFNVFDGKGKYRTLTREAEKRLKKGTWVFEVRGDDDTPLTKPLQMSDRDDSGKFLNIEGSDFHNSTLDRYRRPFKSVFYFRCGKVSGECNTVELQRQRVDTETPDYPRPIGEIAEVAGVKIDLKLGEQLVLVNATDKADVLWRNRYDNKIDGVEGRILNLPPDQAHENKYCNGPYICTCSGVESHEQSFQDPPEDREPSDFQIYYYLVFKQDRPDRFELIVPRYKPRVKTYTAPSGIACDRTVAPYRCGMVLVNSGDITVTR